MKEATDLAAARAAEVESERSALRQLQGEEARLRAGLEHTAAALEELERGSSERTAALEAALRREEAARGDAERALAAQLDAAAKRLERETAQLLQEQVVPS